MGLLDQRFEKNFMISSVDYVFNWARKSAIWPLTFGLACCAVEMIASTTSRFDHCAVRRGSVSPLSSASRLDDRCRHGDSKDGSRSQAHLGADARSEVVHFDGCLFECRRSIQLLFRTARRGSDCSGGCLRGGMSATSRRTNLRVTEASGQNRSDVLSEAAHRGSVASGHGRAVQT